MTFGEYQEAAHSFSKLDEFENPQAELGKRLLSEYSEVWGENGNVDRFQFLYGFTDGNPELKADIAKEIGDIAWFLSEDLTRSDKSLEVYARRALSQRTSFISNINTLSVEQFDVMARRKAGKYTVFNHKLAFNLERKDRHLAKVALAQSPGYVLHRVLGRLVRVMYPAYMENSYGPPTGADFDTDQAIITSRSDTLWVASWIGQTLLDASLKEILQDNLQKLARRETAGTILAGSDIDRSIQE